MKKSILFCLAIGIFFSGCSSTNNINNTKSTNLDISNSDTTFIMGGKIATNDNVDITSNISGRVSEISTELGKKVNSGDIVIKLDTSDLQSKVDQAKSAVNAAQTNLSSATTSTSSNIGEYQSELARVQAQLKTSEASLKDASITAPISGIVSSQNINVGDMVIPGKPLVSIVNADNLYVNVYAPISVLNQIQVGQSVVIKVPDISDNEFSGKISVINSKVNSQSQDVLVKVTLNSKNALLKPGMFAEVGLK
ncbi:efflux RND transporter periplasmic adaptor subunit [Clostridium ljungdahlii]|uniref:Putative multidrug resistance protein EmrK n=1 Tax=Clostridium ljungdahlii TaxID=1538 RepID=A0A166SEL3_9CLOT|nr:efflux RND transporter periplasmic adaptor subunit [Clostridium ljungdahlii]OAA92083.1 putative multidrug resistance protein EmrK [Clostridium ljungdahlii]